MKQIIACLIVAALVSICSISWLFQLQKSSVEIDKKFVVILEEYGDRLKYMETKVIELEQEYLSE